MKISLVASVAGLLIGWIPTVGLSDGWKGKKVLAIDFEATVMDGNEEIGKLTDFDWPRVVEEEKGDSVLLADTKLKGWVKKVVIETLDDALIRRTQAVIANPNSYTYNNRGLALMANDDFELAIEDFTEAIRLGKTEVQRGWAYWNRGESNLLKGDPQSAVEDLTEAIRLLSTKPKNQYECFRLRADAYDKLGKREAAGADRSECERLKQSMDK